MSDVLLDCRNTTEALHISDMLQLQGMLTFNCSFMSDTLQGMLPYNCSFLPDMILGMLA
jgi:hypothetical protein